MNQVTASTQLAALSHRRAKLNRELRKLSSRTRKIETQRKSVDAKIQAVKDGIRERRLGQIAELAWVRTELARHSMQDGDLVS